RHQDARVARSPCHREARAARSGALCVPLGAGGGALMHPEERIEVEPLSELRWARIERSLFERLDREGGSSPAPKPSRPRTLKPAAAFVVAGAIAAAVGAFAHKFLFQAPAPTPSRIVTTSSDSRVAVGESEVDVAPESAVLLSGDDGRGVVVVVDRG